MPRRPKLVPSSSPSATLRWIAIGQEETHSPTAKMSDALLAFLDLLPDPQTQFRLRCTWSTPDS